jgi:hypothetical protein
MFIAIQKDISISKIAPSAGGSQTHAKNVAKLFALRDQPNMQLLELSV